MPKPAPGQSPLYKGTADCFMRTINKEVRPNKKQCFSGPPSSVSNPPHLSFFQTWIKKVASLKSKYQQSTIVYFKWTKKGASLVFDEIKKKSGLICFEEIKKKNCLPHLLFKKVAWETLVYSFLALISLHIIDSPGFDLIRYISMISFNSCSHVETVSSPNHTFSWARFTKRLTSTLCTYFRL